MLDAALLLLLTIATAGTFVLAVSRRPGLIAIAHACLEVALPGGLAVVVIVCVAAKVLGL